jgi:RNA polymerase sigma factor (sigma-70 family)
LLASGVSLSDVAGAVREAAAGSTAAWTALVDQFSGLIWAVLRSQGLSRSDAEDAFQTTWMRFGEQAGRLENPDRVGLWLAKTARNEALRMLRRRRRETPVDLLRDDALVRAAPQELPDFTLEQADRVLWDAFQSLRPICRMLLMLLSADPALTYAEVSAALGIPIGSIGPTRQRCLERLRRDSHLWAVREVLLADG